MDSISSSAAGGSSQLETISTAIIPIERAHIGKYAGGRRSRWERQTKTLLVTTASGQAVDGSQVSSRWGHPENRPYLPPPYIDFPASMTLDQIDQFLREQRLEILNRKLMIGEYEMGDPDIRPPSPLPTYDKDGNRTNRRDIRIKAAMTQEQQRLIEHMVGTVPNFTPPAEFKPQKRIRRILIPNEEFPDYNFMGLIIGPRGCNHKRLEAESGAQISIRGRGTQKEGKRCDHQTDEEAAMPQHVHIAADSDDKLERAVQLIEPLLDPSHPIHEEYKKKGLEQLALVNGTGNFIAKSESKCTVCGLTGHFGFECPETRFETYDRADVICLLCGDRGHVTSDCKLAKDKKLTPQELAAMERDIRMGKSYDEVAAVFAATKENQQEYQNMMTELGLSSPVTGQRPGEGDDSDIGRSRDSPFCGGGAPPPPPPGPETPSWAGGVQAGMPTYINNRTRTGIGFVGEDKKDFQLARDGSFRCTAYAGGGLSADGSTANVSSGAEWTSLRNTGVAPAEQSGWPSMSIDLSTYMPGGISGAVVTPSPSVTTQQLNAASPMMAMFGTGPIPPPATGATAANAWNSQAAAQAMLNMMTMFQKQQMVAAPAASGLSATTPNTGQPLPPGGMGSSSNDGTHDSSGMPPPIPPPLPAD